MKILTLLPSGILVDKINRSIILRIEVMFHFTGYIFIISTNFNMDLFIAQFFINLGMGMISPAQEALIADSFVSNSREKT